MSIRNRDEQREAAFQQYVAATENYNAAIAAAGDEPWHGGDIDTRRELWMRRYQKPAPPVGLTNDLSVIRGVTAA